MNSEQVSLESLRKLVSDSADLASAGNSFHHCGAKREKSCYFAVQPLLALSDGSTSRPAEVVEQSAQAGAWGLTNAWW